MVNAILILQARVGSRRLPSKSVKTFYANKSLLGVILGNLCRDFPANQVVVATTDQPADNQIVEIAKSEGVNHFCGDEHNVLKRFLDAAREYDASHVVRICADNPFIQNEHISFLIDHANNEVDYSSFQYDDGTPSIRSHCGLFAELISVKAMNKIQTSTTESIYLEHLTSYILKYPDDFNCQFHPVPAAVQEMPQLRLTIDSKEDFLTSQEIYAQLTLKHGVRHDIEKLLKFVRQNPHLLQSMQTQIQENTK